MGLFNKMLGYPDPDPTGKSRDFFEKAGTQAMTMFFNGNIERAIKHLEIFAEKQTNSFGENHLDVGRARLLQGGILAFSGQYELGLGMSLVARMIFEDLDEDDMDRNAAEFLYEGLERKADDEHLKVGDYLISPDTPIGQWMLRLKK